MLDNCVRRLEEECRSLSKEVQFRAFKARFLEERPPSGRELAARLGVAETDVTNYLHRAKRRFARIVRDEVLNWVSSPREVDEEIGSLLTYCSR